MKTPSKAGATADVLKEATEAGWLLRLAPPVVVRSPLSRYLSQLLEEGIASSTATGVLIAWDRVYELLTDPAHETSLALLGLPAVASWAPKLISSGSFTDSDFQIVVSGWFAKG